MANTAEEGDIGGYRASAEELLDNYDSVALVAAAIKLLTKEPDTTPVKITEEAPLRIHRRRDRNSGGSRSHSDKRRGNGKKNNRFPVSKNKDGKTRNSRPNGQKRKDGPKERKEPNRSVFKSYFKSYFNS